MAQFSYDPDFDALEVGEEAIRLRVHEAIGDASIPVKIKQMGAWELQSRGATSYRKGRVFIAGDAAHRHTPANGLGSNTSIQDAYNISWKLAAVASGRADDALMDSYEAERRPIGRQIVARATESTGLVAALPNDIGIEAGQHEEEGWAALDSYFAATPEGRQRRALVDQSLKNWDYGIHCHGVEMNHRYTSGAVVDDGTPWLAYELDELDELDYYRPTTHPGGYLPHAWLISGKAKVSTLDLVPPDSWAVITGVEGQSWIDAATVVVKELDIAIAATAVGPGPRPATPTATGPISAR